MSQPALTWLHGPFTFHPGILADPDRLSSEKTAAVGQILMGGCPCAMCEAGTSHPLGTREQPAHWRVVDLTREPMALLDNVLWTSSRRGHPGWWLARTGIPTGLQMFPSSKGAEIPSMFERNRETSD